MAESSTEDCCFYPRIGVHENDVLGPYRQCESCDRFLGFPEPEPGTEAYEKRKASLLEPSIPKPLISPASPPTDPSTTSEDTITIPHLSISEPTPPPAPLKRKRDDEVDMAWPAPEALTTPTQTNIEGDGIPKSIVWTHAPIQHQPTPRSFNRPAWLMPPSPIEPSPLLLPAAATSTWPQQARSSFVPNAGMFSYEQASLRRSNVQQSDQKAQFSRNGFDRSRVASGTKADYANMYPNQYLPDVPPTPYNSFSLNPRLNPNDIDSLPQFAASRAPQTRQYATSGFVNPQMMNPAPQLQVKYKKHQQPIPSHCPCGFPPKKKMVNGPRPESMMEVLVCSIDHCGFYVKLALIEQVRATHA